MILVSALFSCESEEEALLKNPTQIDLYFPITDFLTEQISRLDGHTIKKKVIMNGEMREVDQVLYSRDWREEFDWFIQSDINKASLAQAYDTESTDQMTRHTLKPGEKGVLQKMEIFYDNREVKEIIFHTIKENTFYTSSSTSRLTTGDDGLLNLYELKSNQKVWFLSPNNMVITSSILPN